MQVLLPFVYISLLSFLKRLRMHHENFSFKIQYFHFHTSEFGTSDFDASVNVNVVYVMPIDMMHSSPNGNV